LLAQGTSDEESYFLDLPMSRVDDAMRGAEIGIQQTRLGLVPYASHWIQSRTIKTAKLRKLCAARLNECDRISAVVSTTFMNVWGNAPCVQSLRRRRNTSKQT